jgi:hypothetical protein
MKNGLKAVAVILAMMSFNSYAQSTPDLGLKSETTALLLGLDPIPGDALFYAGKPIQGTINLVVGLPGAFSFFGGLALMAAANSCTDDPADCRGIGMMFTLGGALLYFPMLIWDAAGGISGVKEHNAQVLRHASILQRVEPTVAVTNDGAFGGVRIKF